MSETKPLTREQILKAVTHFIDEAFAAGREQMRQEILKQVAPQRERAIKAIQSAKELFDDTDLSPQKRGAQDRAEHGAIKKAVRDAIYAHPNGISRPQIVRYGRDKLDVIIKDGSLKNAIRILKAEKTIRNANRLWFPAP